ncbi:MAG TPA: hypothetical protein VMB85_17295 [Bryobacteraceae bacterium]|nr:hypothetical protein [Bryobacteraceae bacterium]
MVRRLWPLLSLTMALLSGQRAKPVYDPETRDGLLIQHIEQETDPAQKLGYMEQFASAYPKHPAIAWVYDQLQPAYFDAKSWDQVMRIGELRLALEPENLQAGELALRAAEASHDASRILDWADRVWPLANTLAGRGGANSAEARQTAGYAEFLAYSTAIGAADPRRRLELLQNFEQHMPGSKYAATLTPEYFEIYQSLNDEQKSIEMAEKGLEKDPQNAEMLMYLAEINARKDDPHERQTVIAYTTRAVGALERMPRPASLSEDVWTRRKAALLTLANYLGGVSNSLNHNYSRADVMLRAAVAGMGENDPRLPAALYHLGMANYRLAEAGNNRSRPVDALKFLRRCAEISSPFQQQALKDVAGIKAEYSLP